MTRIANTSSRRTREYRSELRATQAEATRSRILDATLRVMARGIASLSVPAVAREAGVAVPTVYRHFATKADLLAAVYPYLMRRSGADRVPMPRSVDEVRGAVQVVLERMDSLDDLTRAAALSPAAEEARHTTMAQRLSVGRELAALHDPSIAPGDRERIARLMAVLVTTASLRMWRDHLGSSVEEAAEDIDWILRAALAAAGRAAR
jgi:AcrR family transcriptional regulator